MIAVILVGGKPSLVNDFPELPPCLTPVAGRPFLYWLTQWLKIQGFSHIVYSAGHFAERIAAWANHFSTFEPGLCLDVVKEGRPLGTAGATSLCTKRFPSSLTLVANGNSILLAPLRAAIRKLKEKSQLDGIIFGTRLNNAGRFHTLKINAKNRRLIAFKEKQPGDLVNAGVYLFRSQLLEEIDSDKELSLEHNCFPAWLEQNKQIEVIDRSGPFIDIGTPKTLKRAQELIAKYQSMIVR